MGSVRRARYFRKEKTETASEMTKNKLGAKRWIAKCRRGINNGERLSQERDPGLEKKDNPFRCKTKGVRGVSALVLQKQRNAGTGEEGNLAHHCSPSRHSDNSSNRDLVRQ